MPIDWTKLLLGFSGLRKEIMQAKDELEKMRKDVTTPGGEITFTVNGLIEIKAVKINPNLRVHKLTEFEGLLLAGIEQAIEASRSLLAAKAKEKGIDIEKFRSGEIWAAPESEAGEP
ncbi:MAG: YbaB/EbfC family nucleoid-associated protein [Clostridia bacterium]|nr:YbaB/EbfC family nucleoid-associated protein [Clostridia bacterium]